jgi:hypothetical protein
MKFKKWIQMAMIAAVPCTTTAFPSVLKTLTDEQKTVGTTIFTSPSYKPGLVRHIVLFKYRDSITEQQREEVSRRFLALQTTARRKNKPYIVAIETGRQSSGEGADHGFEQAFIVTFCSEGDRNYYVGTPVITDPTYYDPAHAAFKEFAASYLLDVVVFDYVKSDAGCAKPK